MCTLFQMFRSSAALPFTHPEVPHILESRLLHKPFSCLSGHPSTFLKTCLITCKRNILCSTPNHSGMTCTCFHIKTSDQQISHFSHNSHQILELSCLIYARKQQKHATTLSAYKSYELLLCGGELIQRYTLNRTAYTVIRRCALVPEHHMSGVGVLLPD